MNKTTVLVTGGAGFIGSHLCDRLLSEGFRVICLDNLITGSLHNLRRSSGCNRFIFKKHNLEKYIAIKGKLDFVLHFASLASPADYLKFPIQTLNAGSLATYTTLDLAKKKRARYILASTSEVYGDPLVHPQREEYWGNVNPVGVRSCYDESKRFAEALTMAYHRVHKLNTSIIRIFNTYGPRMRINDGRAVPNFIHQALNNRPLSVYGRGRQTRSFCYIDDLIEGILRIMRSDKIGPLNLGNPKEFTILRLAKLVLKLTAGKGGITFKPLPQDDPRQRCPDITLVKKLFNWQPAIELGEGLKMTIEWFSKRKRFP
ncbi:MAG: SDR family oxidoreductase [Candidatus Omnitrophica bacterium]|nr:SDR family oxidoreductase [Candidatus Omnitrophota bacterium]MBL7210553.1 SDR family oxidoreductase [Candidatus Omnitrophota bacterium]